MTEPNPSGIRANPVELKAWLLERHPVVSAVIASRFALRVLPFVVEPTEGSFSARQVRQIISAFRHAALGRLYIKRPSVGLRVVGIALNSVTPKTGDSAGAAVFEACVAAATAADAARSAALSSGPAHRASYAALWASHVDGGDYFWGAIAIERSWIEAGNDPFDLLDKPLWLDLSSPLLAPEPYLARWNSMCSALIREDESWKVWTDWYQDRLSGSPSRSDDIEYFRVTLVASAFSKSSDSSDEEQRRWKGEMDATQKLLRNSARKANRIVAKFLSENKTSCGSAS